ncbi:MFS polyamine transporter [Suillus subalutaceus]|uniref:MFS polyamine transporter n=1 Tax=Suillus subalutaceus TaxID=48586 RepID=UPI001B886248|nr:MFS polyamine transporter [Suillus subalutaceus]KAG1831984.1 MFS polyamine transporter [Suillus subalutaceus]
MSATNQIPASVTNVGQEILGTVSPAPKALEVHHIPERNVLIVDWDGPDDPQNPKNWSYRRKWAATIIISSFTFISPVSSSMIAPATGQVASSFGIDNDVILALTTSVFVLAYAMGPLVLGPLSEIYGRSRVLQLANLWYLVWNLACGFAQSESQLIAFRFLAGLGGSAPLSIGGGFLGDCWQPHERGKAVAIYSLAPLVGPVLGPITGAWVAQYSTWRWVFWSTSIVDAAVQIVGAFALQETYAPLLLERKAERIRRSMDAEKSAVQRNPHRFRSWRTIMTKSLIRPFALFAHEPIVQLLGVYMAYLYGIFYLLLTTMPSIFEGIYQQPVGIAGLHYAALGIGLSAASQLNARTMDKVYIYLTNKYGGVAKPEFRLPAMVPGSLLLPIGCLIVGWTAQAHTYWIAPDIGIALVGAGIILNFQCIQTYIIDCFTLHAASALAAVSCLRSLAGFGFPLFAPAMYNALGFGKGDTILAVVAIVLGCPWILWHYGERIRNSSRHAR